MKTLKITHDAGFFSCCSRRLEAIVAFFNRYKSLPEHIDSTAQFVLYKDRSTDDAIPLYFRNEDTAIPYAHVPPFHVYMQLLPYCTLDIAAWQPFIKKYFAPSQHVQETVDSYEKKYRLDYANTCAVYYRGNDKSIETAIASYETFITKAGQVRAEHPGIVFLVQSDEAEFLEAFRRGFPDSVSFDELSPISKQNSFVAAELPPTERVRHGLQFFASIMVISKCKVIITHSGNGALWSVLYRGNAENVFQWLNGSWNPSGMTLRTLWQRSKRHIRKILGTYPGWTVVSS